MLGGLLKPSWQNHSEEKRRLAILKMNVEDSANQSVFEKLALEDPAENVRLACIKQLSLAPSLFNVYRNQQHDAVKMAAKNAFCNLVGVNTKLSETELEGLIKEHEDASVLIAQHCPYPNLRTQILRQLSQSTQADIIADVVYAETRLRIAHQLDQIEALEVAKRKLKGKDKKSEKVIRTKLEEHRAQLKLQKEVDETALEICQQMEFIANHSQWRSEFKTKYHQLQSRWDALQLTLTHDTEERFDLARSLAQTKVVQQSDQEAAALTQSQITDKLRQYSDTLAPLSLAELADEYLSINAVLGEALATWRESAQVISPAAEIEMDFLSSQQALSSLSDLVKSASEDEIIQARLAKSLQSLHWPDEYSVLLAKNEALDLLNALKKQQRDQEHQNKHHLDALHKRINRLLGTSTKGNIKQAKHELAATNKAAQSYSGKERKILDERLEKAAEIVSKMSDWQNFATEPKLIELCEAMERLIDSNSHADKLAKQISKLQNSWKNLGHADVSDEHWVRFKAAADLAFAPCAKFFEQRRTIQKENLAKREPLINQLQQIFDDTDWNDTPDYKAVETSLRKINNEWRKIKDVERSAGQKQWHRFSAIKDSIYQKLDVVYDENIEKKHQLIAQVTALADGLVNDGSLEKLKLYQNRWQQLGITRRKQDQEAWTQFRAAGDQVFEKVQDQRNEKRAIENQKINVYKSVIKEIHSLAKSSVSLADADAEFSLLCEKYQALPSLPKELPEKLVERIESDFRRARDAYSQAHDRLIQASRDEVLKKLGEKAELCSLLEASIINSGNNIGELKRKIDDIILSDKTLEKRFEKRLSSVAVADKSAANHARTRLCIDLEILFDVASPEHDKALRMQVQLERMKTIGLGQSASERSKALTELKLDWWCLPGADPEHQKILETRFANLIKTHSL